MPIWIVPFIRPATNFIAADLITRKADRTFVRSLIRNHAWKRWVYYSRFKDFCQDMETIGRLLFYGHSYTKEETKKAAFLPNLRLNECRPYGGLRLFLQAAQTFLGKRAKFWHSFNDFTLHFNRIVL